MTTANTNVIARVAAVVAGIGLVATSFAAALPAQAATAAEIEAQIAALQAQLAGSTSSSACTFTRDLTVGSQGADVTCLQNALAAKGYFTVAATGYFGTVTQAAVAKWQAAAGITPAAGYFGPISRAKFSSMGGGSSNGGSNGGSNSGLSGGEADLRDFELRAEDGSGDEGEEMVDIASAEFEVENGDARVERVELTFDAASSTLEQRPWQYFDTIYVMVDGDEVADIDASDRGEWDETTDDVYVLTFTGLDVVVDEGDKVELTFAADISDNIDTDDQSQTFTVYVDDEGIRAVDSEGIQQYIGDDTDTISFGFGAEDNGDLQIKSNDENPDTAILVADDEDESEDYTVFVFDIENDGDADSLITDLTVDIATTSAGLTDMVRTVTLVVDGDEFDGDIDNNTGEVDFEDIDVEVASDEEVTFEVMVTLKANASSGTITLDVAAADVDAEGVDSGDAATVSGSQDSETHTVALTGIAVEPVSTSESVVTPGSSAADTYGTFTIKFDVTALEDDAYIASTTDNAAAGFEGVVYTVVQDGTASTTFAGSAVLSSTADTSSGFFVVDQGDTETFTLTVTLNPTAAGTFEVQLTNISFNDEAAYTGETVYTIDTNNDDYQTDPTYIAN